MLQCFNLNAYLQLTAIKVPEINRSIFCRVLQYKADSKEGLKDLKTEALAPEPSTATAIKLVTF